MATRFSYWVIVAGTTPTAFRARRREDLLPTLRQLQRTQPQAGLRWFDRGRLWFSVEEAEASLKQGRRDPSRGRDWRPGGTHVDPRARYQLSRDEKRARFKQRSRRPPTAGAKPAGRSSSSGEKPAARSSSTSDRPRRPKR